MVPRARVAQLELQQNMEWRPCRPKPAALQHRLSVNVALLGSRHQPVYGRFSVWGRQEDRARVHRAARQLRLEPPCDTPVLFRHLSSCCCPDAVVPRCRGDARLQPGRGFRGRVQHAGGSKPVCERSRKTRGTCRRQWFWLRWRPAPITDTPGRIRSLGQQ